MADSSPVVPLGAMSGGRISHHGPRMPPIKPDASSSAAHDDDVPGAVASTSGREHARAGSLSSLGSFVGSSDGEAVPVVMVVDKEDTHEVLFVKSTGTPGLLRAFFQVFHGNEMPSMDAVPFAELEYMVRGCFFLRDSSYAHTLAYENFDASSLEPGATIEVHSTRLYHNVLASGMLGGLEEPGDDVVDMAADPNNKMKMAMLADLAARGKKQPKTFKEHVWAVLDDPDSGRLGFYMSMLILALIVYSTCTFCLETLWEFYDPDVPKSSFWYVSEAICIAIFSVEFVSRLSSCPDKKAFMRDGTNIIDLVAIVPFYLELAMQNMEVPGLAVIRVVRLVRVFRLMKNSKNSISLFGQTLSKSIRPLQMLILMTSMGMVVAASLVYYAERGRYNETLGLWERPTSYVCEVQVTKEEPMPVGFTYPPRKYQYPYGPCEPLSFSADRKSAVFACELYHRVHDNCRTVYSQTPFDSIPATFWFALVTMSTVGYGDIGPISWVGKLLGMVTMVLGILVLALPITVIGSNFANAYNDMLQKEEERERVRRLAAEMLREQQEMHARGHAAS